MEKLIKYSITKETYNEFLRTYKITQNHEIKRYEGYVKAAQDILNELDVSGFIRNKAFQKEKNALDKISEIKENLRNEDIIIEQILNSRKLEKEILENNRYKQNLKTNEKKRKDEIRENFYKNIKDNSKLRRNQRYQMKRAYYYLKRQGKFFPAYMRRNLQNMPNNKGYIWRNIHYYGEKKAEKGQPIVLFEKKGAVLHIHEITKNFHKVYEKKTKTSNRKLIQNIKRINPFNKVDNTIYQYIKLKK